VRALDRFAAFALAILIVAALAVLAAGGSGFFAAIVRALAGFAAFALAILVVAALAILAAGGRVSIQADIS